MAFFTFVQLSALNLYKPSTSISGRWGGLGILTGLLWKGPCFHLYISAVYAFWTWCCTRSRVKYTPTRENGKVPSNRKLLSNSNKNRLQHMPHLYAASYQISDQSKKCELRFLWRKFRTDGRTDKGIPIYHPLGEWGYN